MYGIILMATLGSGVAGYHPGSGCGVGSTSMHGVYNSFLGYGCGCVGHKTGMYPSPYLPTPILSAASVREGLPLPKAELAIPLSRAPQAVPATVTVVLPAAAKLFAQGRPTEPQGTERTFQTPPLPAGEAFEYTLRIEYGLLTEAKTVAVRAGQAVRVEFGGDVRLTGGK